MVDIVREELSSRYVSQPLRETLTHMLSPRVLGKSDGAFDIGMEKMKADMIVALTPHLGPFPWATV